MVTIEEFLEARIHETMNKIKGFPRDYYMELRALCESQLYIIEWHKKWPVLVEKPPEVKVDYSSAATDSYIYKLSQDIAWLTQEEYRKKFGSEPPTAPLLRQMAMMYAHHPDWNEEW